MSTIKKNIPVTVEIATNVNPEWIEMCTQHTDLFMQSYCGYWARGLERTNARGWLVFESAGEIPRGEEPNKTRAVREWRTGNKLPQLYHRLDEAAAIRAWKYGVEKWGLGWYDDADATSYDIVIQLALLGEVRYG